MTARLRCLVPHCRRTKKSDGHTAEWICATHWQAGDRAARLAYAKARRAFAAFVQATPDSADRVDRWQALHAAWTGLKQQCIDRALGIG